MLRGSIIRLDKTNRVMRIERFRMPINQEFGYFSLNALIKESGPQVTKVTFFDGVTSNVVEFT